MWDARSRLLLALGASAALHLSLIYGVAVRAPAPLALPLVARLQLQPPSLGAAPAPVNVLPSPAFAAVSVARGGAPAGAEQSSMPPPGASSSRPAPPTDSALPTVTMPLLVDPTWYSAQQLDVYPRALSLAEPGYPPQAAQERIGGEVMLLLLVDERGTVEEASVAQAVPEGYFEAAAVAAFQTARFQPAQKDGRSVRSRLVVRVLFDPASLEESIGRQREAVGQQHP